MQRLSHLGHFLSIIIYYLLSDRQREEDKHRIKKQTFRYGFLQERILLMPHIIIHVNRKFLLKVVQQASSNSISSHKSFLMKILILSFFLVLCSLLYSQGNLQFNQVLTISGNTTMSSNYVKVFSPIQTVPLGKVWKIEFVGSSSFTSVEPTYPGSKWGISVNTRDIVLFFGYGDYESPYSMPIWLKAGDQLRFYSTTSSWSTGNNVTTNYVFSILEFNIIP